MDKIKLLLIGLLLCLVLPSISADPSATGAQKASANCDSCEKVSRKLYSMNCSLDSIFKCVKSIKESESVCSENKDLFLYSLLGFVIIFLLFIIWLLYSRIIQLLKQIISNADNSDGSLVKGFDILNKEMLSLYEKLTANLVKSFNALNKEMLMPSEKLSNSSKGKTQPEIKNGETPFSPLICSLPITPEETVSVIYCGLPSKDMILFKATSDDSRRFIVEGTGDVAFLTIVEEYAKALLESHDALRGVVEIKEGNRSATVSKITVLKKGKVKKMDQDRWKITDPIEIKLS